MDSDVNSYDEVSRSCSVCCMFTGDYGERTAALWGHEWAAVAFMATSLDRLGYGPEFVHEAIASYAKTPEQVTAEWQEWANDNIEPDWERER